MSTLLLVDSAIVGYEKIVAAALPSVTTVVFDKYVDTFGSLKDKINATAQSFAYDLIEATPNFQTVGIVQHGNSRALLYRLLMTQSIPAQLYNIEKQDPELNTWSELIDFYSFLKSCGATTIDLISCALYANKGWVYALQQLETRLGIDFRASINNTGNIASGGDWIQESDGVNIQTIYFTEEISKFTGLLRPRNYSSSSQMAVKPGAMVGSTPIKGSQSNTPFVTANTLPNYFVKSGSVAGTIGGTWNQFGDVSFSSAGVGSGVVAVSSAYPFFAGLRSDGTVFCWGSDGGGGVIQFNSFAAEANSGSPVVAISGNDFSSTFSALRADGTIYAWGSMNDSEGVLNNTMVTNAGSGNVAIAQYEEGFIAIKADGSVYVWGTSDYIDSVRGVFSGSTGIIAIDGGYSSAEGVKSDGTAVSPYDISNNSGFIGISSSSYFSALLRSNGSAFITGAGEVPLNDIVNVATVPYDDTFCFLRSNGHIYCWQGNNITPVGANTNVPFVAIAASLDNFSCLRSDGTVYNFDLYGGNGQEIATSGIIAISANAYAFAGLRADGSVDAWGDVNYGGDPAAAAAANSGSPVISIASVNGAFCALRQDGTVYAWGDSTTGGNNAIATAAAGSGNTAIYGNYVSGFTTFKANPAAANASTAVSEGTVGNYVALSADPTPTVVINTRTAINASSGATRATAKLDYIKSMIDRVGNSSNTIPSTDFAAFKETLLSGASNLTTAKDIVQYFPQINAQASAATLEITSFVSDLSKYISIEMPINVPIQLLENGVGVGYIFYDGTNLYNGSSSQDPVINPGSSVTFGTKTISKIAVGSLTGDGGAGPVPSPAILNERPEVLFGNAIIPWYQAGDGTSSITLTLTGTGGSTVTLPATPNIAGIYTFSNLTPGEKYTLTLQARNENGDGPLQYYKPVTVGSLATAPTNLVGSFIGNDVILNWNFPTSDGSSPIGWYGIQISNTGALSNVEGRLSTHTVFNTANLSYTYTVRAINDAGWGPGASVSVSNMWDPMVISSSIAFWHDASTIEGTTGTAVGSWPSRVGSLNAANMGSTPPTLKTNALNGKNVVYYGPDQWHQISASFADNWTFISVSRLTGRQNGRVFTAGGNFLIGYWTGLQDVLFMNGNPGNETLNPGILTTTNWNMYTLSIGTFTRPYAMFKNGAPLYSASSSTGFYNSPTYNNQGGETSDCEIAEVLVFSQMLSTENQQKTEGYLAWKYGLQGYLPANHPYKSAPPTQ